MTALMDAVATSAAAGKRLYPVGSVPAKPVYPYSTFAAQLGRGDTYLLDASEGARWGRIVVQTFGKSADSTITDAEAHRGALVGRLLALPGYDTSPVQSELDPTPAGRDPDDNGVVSLTATYTFTAAKEQP